MALVPAGVGDSDIHIALGESMLCRAVIIAFWSAAMFTLLEDAGELCSALVGGRPAMLILLDGILLFTQVLTAPQVGLAVTPQILP